MIEAGSRSSSSHSDTASSLRENRKSSSLRYITSEKMPIVRRRRPLMKLSSSPLNQVDAQGTAYLCFPEDYSWFQGNISTEDESNYSLYGERITVSGNNNGGGQMTATSSSIRVNVDGCQSQVDHCSDIGKSAASSSHAKYYRVTMIDYFSGQKHSLPKIVLRGDGSTPSVGHLFASQHGEVTFQVENVYKGQKADIMIHRFLGAPNLLGKKCLLYSGQINILYNDIAETGRSWSL